MFEAGRGGINRLCQLIVVLSHVQSSSTSPHNIFVTTDTGPKYLTLQCEPTTCFSLPPPPRLSTFQVRFGQLLQVLWTVDRGLIVALLELDC